MNINSKEYWNKRFETNWKEYAGDKQTVFFANLVCDLLPDYLIKEAMTNDYSICDMGCALGDGVRIFSRKFNIDVEGMDFSEKAIEAARKSYPQNKFWVGDILNLDSPKEYDISICSNVLEHFANPWKIVKNLTKITKKYLVIMVPYKEKLKIDEHEYYFSEEVIPIQLEGFRLDYVRTVDGSDFQETYYPGQQILMIYKRDNHDIQMLDELSKGIVDSAIRNMEQETEKHISRINEQFNDRENTLKKEAEKEKEELLRKTKNLIDEKDNIINEKEHIINEKEHIIDKKDCIISEKEQEVREEKEQAEKIRASVTSLEQELAWRENAISNAKQLCIEINRKTSYKVLCALARFGKQFLLGPMTEKKKFLGICKRFITRTSSEFTKDDGYNMILNIRNLLEIPYNGRAAIVLDQGDNVSGMYLQTVTVDSLNKKYDKPDILIFSVIDYDFRYQRPQHFARRFAENGHRVFYINANFVNKDEVKQIAENLYVINIYNEKYNAIYFADKWDNYSSWFCEKMNHLITLYAIKDAISILDYPNWFYGAKYLRDVYGIKIVVDYMDDCTGFLDTTTKELKENCICMLKESDLVIASSQFLCDIAGEYTRNLAIVRNGTEVDHFYQAVGMEVKKERPVIGYYGAVSHWFAWEKVCYIAEHMPECDIVLIGAVTDYKEKFQKYKNIKLLGEMNYKDLPKHLAYFDVCLIPFDTSTDLIKATNPVKFYEYLSAGKRIVATEIPELEPYHDQYVYMSNDNEKFLDYVKRCVECKDELANMESSIAFAKENDWQKRYEKFAEYSLSIVPKVSIIVLTYNNLNLNKYCIESILTETAYPNYELIIVDNQSTDGTITYLKELEEKGYSQVKVIYNQENMGFAGGNNRAIREATGKYIMLLNNDTVVTRGWLTNAVKHMENDASCGMCGAVTNSIGNEAMVEVNYRNLKELKEFAYEYTCIHNNDIYTDVDRLAMFCTLIRKEILDQYGLLDENYEVGMFEDDDYAKTVEKAGYRIYVVEDVFVHHVNNASFKKIESEEYKKIFEKNKRYYEEKWGTEWKMAKYRSGVTTSTNAGMMIEPIE